MNGPTDKTDARAMAIAVEKKVLFTNFGPPGAANIVSWRQAEWVYVIVKIR
jgi:hypothetical protein